MMPLDIGTLDDMLRVSGPSTRSPSLTFYGGPRAVSGGRFLVETPNARVLVECGTFEGSPSSRRRNWSPAPDELRRLDAIVLTQASLDHCGYLPALAGEGWHGPIFVTPGTADLVPVTLTDSARLFAEDAAEANALGWSTHHPALPPFHESDTVRVGELLRRVDFGETVEIADGVRLEFGRTGHLLGSAWAHLRMGDRGVVFCGELGGPDEQFPCPPEPRPDCETLVLEAASEASHQHGGHGSELFAAAIHRAVHAGGSVLVPMSAVDRTETVLTTLRTLIDDGAVPDLPVYLDSPTGLDGLEVYRRAYAEQRPGEEIRIPRRTIELRTAVESHHLMLDEPSIVVAGPGSAAYGRVLRRLATMLPDSRNVIVFLGCVPPETPAHLLVDGARQLKVHGRYVPVRAEIFTVAGLGCGTSRLHDWATAGSPPETTYVVHGHADSATAMAKRLHADEGWCAVVPDEGERVLL